MASTPQSELDKPFELSPLTIVLAKVKGYPNWPAMILDESILPENVLQKKPKTTKIKPKKKNAKPIGILPVRFFSDDTYIWLKTLDMKILDIEQIDEYLAVDKKKRKDQLLYKAYRLAKDAPSMESFVLNGSSGKKRKLEVKEEGIEEDLVDLEQIDENERFSEDNEDEEEYGTVSAKKKLNTPVKAKRTKVTVAMPKNRKDPNEEGYDSDWGLEGIEYDYENGNYIYENEVDQIKFVNSFPSGNAIAEEYIDAASEFAVIESTLLEELLQDPERIKQKELFKRIEELRGSIEDFPRALSLRSKLFRVLILTARKPFEEFPYKSVKESIGKLLVSWADIDITENTVDQLKELEVELDDKALRYQSQEPEKELLENASHPNSAKDVNGKLSNFKEETDIKASKVESIVT